MIIFCHTGLAGRVTAIANGLHFFGVVQFGWMVNKDLPLTHEQVFPRGIPGVEFFDVSPGSRMTRIEGQTCDCYVSGVDYAPVMRCLGGQPQAHVETAIIARFCRHPQLDPVAFAKQAAKHAKGLTFLMADKHRAIIGSRLDSYQSPLSKELEADMRRSKASMIPFISDWLTAMTAQTIITHEQPTGLIHPAIAAGKRIICVRA